eukprot:XP_012808530.2 PREDICTED: hepatic lectin-like [Xenopus tropicalis]
MASLELDGQRPRSLKASETLGTQRRLLMVLVTLLVLVFMFLIILTCLMFIYYSRISEAIDSIKQDIQTVRKERPQCDSDWKSFNGSCYYIVTTEKNWMEAQAFCKSMNSDLVIITSEREQKFLESLTDKSYFWIGLKRDKDDKKVWRWVDGTLHNLSDGFWYEDEPNNKYGTEDCVLLWKEEKWNDDDCIDQYKAICEK